VNRTIAAGMFLTVVAAGLLRWQFGPAALLPAVVFGLLAVAIQLGAGRAMRGATLLPHAEFLKRYGIGMGLRLGGVVVLLLAIVLRRDLFPPLPTALGFLGVLIPLLFLEARPTR
jgi:hypothetical protein